MGIKFELEDFEQAVIRVALVQLIGEFERVLGFESNSEKDKELWSRRLEESKSAFKKINEGRTIEEYRDLVK
ncbi:hypothetical protein GC101_17250 [Paenibacillus sp. LMG 31459]|uniref:Uncharacterized protein n=1 Tax=Paenibacillus phytohabitans TaxID=2654978 RepID=A0ABX1YIC2_9BACL|nr:hypothetical protein [Paenibacillus phytohabitans]NOU80613.1 hypothetical protein [Paenibacillus phytohabitans]